MKYIHYIILAALMLLSSCGNKKIAADIQIMQSHPIDLSACEEAICYKNGKKITDDIAKSTYKLIIYIDSLSCSPCYISHMYDYEETIEKLDSVGIKTIFVFEPNQEKEDDVMSLLEQYACPFWSVIIRNGAFASQNPHLPSSSQLHSFLLNKNNEVVVVGNPFRNNKIKELILNNFKQ